MTEAPHAHFKRHRFPVKIIAHAVWLYYRFPLSLRDVEDLLAARGIEVSFQTVSEWAAKFGLKFSHQLRRRSQGRFADKWQLDEMVVTIKGRNTGCGAPSMQTVRSSMPCCKAEGTRQQRCV
ncbi:transposase-like protein [Rhizobium sp. BK491]|nr:transposase-like protein [Rhizobium sp. BK491]